MTAAVAPISVNRGSRTANVIGYCLLVVWVLFALAIVWSLATGFDNYSKYLPKYWGGLQITLLLVGLSLVFGAALSFLLVLARLSGSCFLQGIAFAYMYFFRGTPLIAQIFLIYYGVGGAREFFTQVHLWWLFRDPFNCAVLVFSLNTAAYQAEILRGAILNVPKGQAEAAQALGVNRVVIFFRILLPQALITSLRPYGNEVILLLKGSAIASIITVFDLMGETRRAFSRTFDYNTYILAAAMYLMLVEIVRRVWNRLEKRITRHLRL